MKVSEIMTRQVECIPPKTTIREAAEKMQLLDVGFLPICEDEQLLGTITDRDIAIRGVAEGIDPQKVNVRHIMTPNAFYCFEDQDVEDVSESMQQKEVKRMLILDRDRKLVGVVSLGDISMASGEQQLAGETLREISEAA
jgi:CBS domain-containing protein